MTETSLPPDHEATGHPRRWLILAVLVVSLIVVVLDNTVLNVALKTLADPDDGLGASQSELAWMINSYTLVFAGLLFALGVIGDRIGRRRMLLAGMAVFGLASLLSAFAQTAGQLVGFRALMGAGAAAMMPATLALLRSLFSDDEFPKALGIWSGAVGVGGALGPIVGGLLLERFWWGSVFLINVPIVVFGVVMIVLLAPESRGRQGRPDLVGMGLSVLALVLLTYGIIEAGDSGSWGSVSVWGTILLGVLGLAAFVRWELRTPHASLDMRLFRNPRFSSAAAIIALGFFAMLGLFFFITFYIQLVRDRTPLQTGLLFLSFGSAMLVFSPLSPSLVARFGARTVGLVSLTLITGVFVGYAQLDTGTPLWVLVVMLFLQATGMANLMTPAMNTLMASVPREHAGVASALGNTLRQVGGAFGVAVLGTVMAQAYQGRVGDRLPGLSEEARTSLSATYGAVERGLTGGAATRDLLATADQAFVEAMHVTAYTSAAIAVVGLLVVARFFPGRQATADSVAGGTAAVGDDAGRVAEAAGER
ncbi:DHA2 family efflux MFS transporter permease subunit [Nocardioides sp. SYSU DS0651]|uniref:DHA2 family efflux MFS transporter permease subunit n=1 Tax=Nocardioides sp. SYSU DS0651 TaxID=3415955 RepID=UPI003F4B4E6B